MTRPVFIAGKTVDLVPLTGEDATMIVKWLNDLDTILKLGPDPFPSGRKKQEEYLDGLYRDRNQLILGIQFKSDGELIGTGGLAHIEWVNQRAELTMCIGETDRRGCGCGTEATRLILSHAFGKLNLHSVMLRVIAYNERAIRCYTKCGFRTIGRRREAKLVDGKYHDVIYMDILAAEFFSSARA